MNWLKNIAERGGFTRLAERLSGSSDGAVSTTKEYRRGDIVYHEGDACPGLYLILSGRCEVCTRNKAGRISCLGVRGAGNTFGHWEMMNQEKCRHTVRVTEDSVLLCLKAGDLVSLLNKRPTLLKEDGDYIERMDHKNSNPQPLPMHYGRVCFLGSLNGLEHFNILFESLKGLFDQEEKTDPYICIELVRSGGIDLRKWKDEKECFQNHLRLTLDSEAEYWDHLPAFLSSLGLRYPYIFMVSRTGVHDELLPCILHSDIAFLLLQQNAREFYELNLLRKKIIQATGEGSVTLHPVFSLTRDEKVSVFNESWNAENISQEAYHLRFNSGSYGFDYPLNTLAREIKQERLGLALSSGGAKGLSHIGVIQVLEEHGIEVDVLAGSSMGAYIAGLWSMGLTGSELEEKALELESHWEVLKLIDPVWPPREGFIRGDRVRKRLQRAIGNVHFGETFRPIRVIGTRLDTLEREVFQEGEVAQAVHASAAIPGVCAPVTINGISYVDGGIADPVPVDVLKEMGIEKVIAVKTLPTPELLREWSEMEHSSYEGSGNRKSGFLAFMNRHFNYFAYGNILNTMMRSVHAVQMRIADQICEQADVVLNPLCCDAQWTDFASPRKYIELGRMVAETHLEEILELVKKPSNQNDNELVKEKLGATA